MTLELIPIIPGLVLVPGENKGRFPFCHSLLVSGDIQVLIDAGCGEGVIDALREEHPVDYVISSHCHPDHTSLNWKFSGVPLYAPKYSVETFGNLDRLGERFMGSPETAVIWREFVTTTLHFRTALPTHTFEDNSVFDIGTLSFTAIHTPGHTVDHMCLFEPKEGILLSFDIDLSSFGPWYGHPESDIEAFERSIRRVMELKPRRIVSSHLGIIADHIQERLQRFLDVFAERDRLLLSLLPQSRSVKDLLAVSPFYHGYPSTASLLARFEEWMIRNHLVRLQQRGDWVPDGNFQFSGNGR